MTSEMRQQLRNLGTACVFSFFVSATATYLLCAFAPKKRAEIQTTTPLSNRITLSQNPQPVNDSEDAFPAETKLAS